MNMPPYLETGLIAIAYGAEQQLRQWQEIHDRDGYYPSADAEDLRIHVARRLLVLAETPTITILPQRAHGHPEGCTCEACRMIQAAYTRSEALRTVEAIETF